MKFYRYIIFIAISIIVVPFIGISMTWKQIILALLGSVLFIIVAFWKQTTPDSNTVNNDPDSGSSFQDSEPVEENNTEPNPTASVKEVLEENPYNFQDTSVNEIDHAE